MDNEILIVDQTKAIAESKRGNYHITSPLTGNTCELIRDKDFMVIPGTKRPSILKEGCEKIVNAYGLIQRYSIESKIEEPNEKNPLFYYLVKCELVKVMNPLEGKEIVLSTGYGSANSREKRNGLNSAFDSANNTVKMAVKRSLTAATVAIAGLSDLFTMDMENEAFMKSADEFTAKRKEDAPMSKAQRNRLFATAADYGLTAEQAKNVIKSLGFNSTKDITQKDYDNVIEEIKKKGQGE